MNSEPCCKTLEGGLSRTMASPFHITSVGYYDGPTTGLLKCRACGNAFHFELLAATRDDSCVRLYALARIQISVYEQLIAAEESGRRRAFQTIETIVFDGTERNLIVATDDIYTRILKAAVLTVELWMAHFAPVADD